MTPDDAKMALEQVERTDSKLADRMHWPFQRHAIFALAEALIVMGFGMPAPDRLAAFGVGAALVPILIYQDKARYGMFISGWAGRKTRPMMLRLMAFLVGAMALSYHLRWDDGTNPLVIGVFAIVLVVCTWASIRWERVYRAELSGRMER